MPCEWIERESQTLRARLSGVLTGADRDEIESATKDAIGRFGSVRCLIILDDFQGWKRGEAWGDLSFQQEHDDKIERIAVVGDEQWRDDVLAYMVAPLRSTEIQYFAAHHLDQANAWLER